MALSKEWTEWHLTPEGWVMGSRKTDFTDSTRMEDPPDTRVVTVRFHETISSMYSSPDRWESTTWQSDNEEEIKKLVKQYGEAPKAL